MILSTLIKGKDLFDSLEDEQSIEIEVKDDPLKAGGVKFC